MDIYDMERTQFYDILLLEPNLSFQLGSAGGNQVLSINSVPNIHTTVERFQLKFMLGKVRGGQNGLSLGPEFSVLWMQLVLA